MTTYSYTGAMETITLSAGTYLFECYGAAGGSGNIAGYGGYAAGEFTIATSQDVYLFVGGKPTVYNAAGFNGGAGADDGWGGGGGTDIRIGGTAIADRVIVGGGGGGAKNGRVALSDGGQTLDENHQLFQGYQGPWTRNGGGGGYRGGYSNGWYNDPGEGGSSYVSENAENPAMTSGVNSGDGYIVITPLSAPPTPQRMFAQII